MSRWHLWKASLGITWGHPEWSLTSSLYKEEAAKVTLALLAQWAWGAERPPVL